MTQQECEHEPSEGAGPHGETLCMHCGAVLHAPRRATSVRIQTVRAGKGVMEINLVSRETR